MRHDPSEAKAIQRRISATSAVVPVAEGRSRQLRRLGCVSLGRQEARPVKASLRIPRQHRQSPQLGKPDRKYEVRSTKYDGWRMSSLCFRLRTSDLTLLSVSLTARSRFPA